MLEGRREKYLPTVLVSAAQANPLSIAAQALRDFAFSGLPIQPTILANMVLSSIPFAILGAFAYSRALHMLQVRRKL